MAKYNDNRVYTKKDIISPEDSILLNDSEDFNRQKTVYFKDIAKFVNSLNETSFISYIYTNLTDALINENVQGYFSTNNNTTLLQNITVLKINKSNFGELNLSELYDFILINYSKFTFKLINSNNQNIIGFYNIESIVKIDDHYEFNVSVLQNNLTLGSLENGKKYVFDLVLKASLDIPYDVDFPYAGAQTFTIPRNLIIYLVFLNDVKIKGSQYTRTSSTEITIVSPTLVTDDVITVTGNLK